MALQIENISDDAIQQHIILFEENEINLTLRFYEIVQMWCFDATYKDKSVFGIKLSAGVLHMRSQNFPFDFLVETTEGIDPYKIDDFSTARSSLYLVTREDMETIRGVDVEI